LIGSFQIYFGKKLNQQYIITPPYSTDIGLKFENLNQTVFNSNKHIKNIMEAVADYLAKQNVMFVDVILPFELKDAQPFIWQDFEVSIKYTYLLNLSATEEDILAQMSSERRKNIKDAKLIATVSSCADLNLAFNKIRESLDSNGAKYNEKIIQNLLTEFPDADNYICIQTHVNEVLSSIHFMVKDDTTAYYLFGWNNKELSSTAGTLGLWSGILEAKKQGLNTFNFAGSAISSIEKYFRGFGAELTPQLNIKKQNFVGKTLLKLKR
jgi:lipid II:glycine glycyltransferase (peptidoglycan interpeptide bridge formation enzyme)